MRGVSQIVVLVLLLLITLSLATLLFTYLTRSQEDITSLIEDQQEIELKKVSSSMKILGADPNSGNITIRNTGRFDIERFNLFLNGIQTGINSVDKLIPGATTVIDPIDDLLPGSYEIKVTASYAEAFGYMIIPGDSEIPQWSLQNQNASQGVAFELYTFWTDDVMLDYAILSTNESGSWSNTTSSSLGAQSDWSNYTWSGSVANDTDVSWKIYVNDSDGNWNVTDTKSFTIFIGGGTIPPTPNPKWYNPYIASYMTHSGWYDNETEISFTWLSTNETGSWKNYTAREASHVVDDMIDNATWVPGVPWPSASIVGYFYNTTQGYIRDGNEMGLTFVHPFPCENGTTNYNVAPFNAYDYFSIVYWTKQMPDNFPLLTAMALGSSSNGGFCFSPETMLIPQVWERIEHPLIFDPVDPNVFHEDKGFGFCDPNAIDIIVIYYLPPDPMLCDFSPTFVRLDELYLTKPPHDDFDTLFTWKNRSIGTGTKIGWKTFANDTNGYENVTSVGTITAP